MSSLGDWVVPPAVQPHAEDYDFDLEAALSSVVGVRALIPSDAFTAETLGDERHGNGVLLSGGLVLTIGYLIVEADTMPRQGYRSAGASCQMAQAWYGRPTRSQQPVPHRETPRHWPSPFRARQSAPAARQAPRVRQIRSRLPGH